MWQGNVDGRSNTGTPSVMLKKGDVVSILATGWIKFGDGDTEWAGLQSPIPPCKSGHAGSLGSLVATIGDDKTRYPIGNGKLHWAAPAEGLLTFLFDDQAGKYRNNSGSFAVEVVKETAAPAPAPAPGPWTGTSKRIIHRACKQASPFTRTT